MESGFARELWYRTPGIIALVAICTPIIAVMKANGFDAWETLAVVLCVDLILGNLFMDVSRRITAPKQDKSDD